MDDATNLASELLDKLSELEQKVEHHRRDMATEFQRYSRHLLADAPEELSTKVEKAIKDSMHNYPALGPVLDLSNPIRNDSPDNPSQVGNDRSRRGRTSPPPLLPHTSGTPPESGTRSPHEREKEFAGLFTPSYLPLLDGRDNKLSPPTSPSALPLTQVQVVRELTQDPGKAEDPSSPPPALPQLIVPRPEPVRRRTEDTLSSCTSDDSASRIRRSALRRSSSVSTKTQSPRRVRFEVEGGEVLPTVSPPMSPRVIDHQASPLGDSNNLMNVSSYDSAFPDDGDNLELLGSSPPRPKKVTSTDKLKALMRSSNEDTSKWTVVGDQQDPDEDDDVFMMGRRNTAQPSASVQTPGTSAGTVPMRHDTNILVSKNSGDQTVEYSKGGDESNDQEEAEEEGDEDLLEMTALTSFKGRKNFPAPQPATSSANVSNASRSAPNNTVTTPKQTNNPAGASSDGDYGEEDMFDYEPDEDAEESASSRNTSEKSQPPAKYVEEDEEEEHQEASAGKSSASEPVKLSLYSSSPAITFGKVAISETPATPSRYAAASIGSYKGRPYTMSSISNKEVHDKAAQITVPTVIGSVHDLADPTASFRGEPSIFDGTPKSLSQRLMLEEYQASRGDSPRTGANR